MYRSMIQLDPRKRPRVEDLESLSALQPAMNTAKTFANDFKTQQVRNPSSPKPPLLTLSFFFIDLWYQST